MSVFLIDSYMQGISIDMEEAAAIDGAGLLKTMFIIMMPLCKPILSTVVILTFMHVWNEFAFAQVLISQESLKTIPIGLTYGRRGEGMTGQKRPENEERKCLVAEENRRGR